MYLLVIMKNVSVFYWLLLVLGFFVHAWDFWWISDLICESGGFMPTDLWSFLEYSEQYLNFIWDLRLFVPVGQAKGLFDWNTAAVVF